MTAVAAVGVYDNFAPGEAGVAHGPADDEAAGRVDVELRFRIEHFGGNDGLDDVLGHSGAKVFVRNGIAVLRRNHYAIDAVGLAIAIFDGYLRLAVGTKEIELLVLADLG